MGGGVVDSCDDGRWREEIREERRGNEREVSGSELEGVAGML